MFYMPTLALSIAVSYSALKRNGKICVKDYPPIRVWGTIGFIAALWVVDVCFTLKRTSSAVIFVASAAALFLGLYAFTLPTMPARN